MRIPALAILAFAAVSVATPAKAQTYDPSYPVCLHVYRVNYYECRYVSMAQCAASASGRPAQCLLNPYFAGGYDDPPVRHSRGYRRAY